MHGLNEVLDEEKANWNVLCVVLSVTVWYICCWSVRLIVVVEVVLWLGLRSFSNRYAE